MELWTKPVCQSRQHEETRSFIVLFEGLLVERK